MSGAVRIAGRTPGRLPSKITRQHRTLELTRGHKSRPRPAGAGTAVLRIYLPLRSSRFRATTYRIATLSPRRDRWTRRSERVVAAYGRICAGVKLMAVEEPHASGFERHGSLLTVLSSHLSSVLVEQTLAKLKRSLDIVLTLGLSMVLSPLLLALALLVKLSSPGPVLYGHTRIGRNGTKFRMWKFRSMYLHGDDFFERCLEKDPALRQEWLENRKLRRDPRVTPVGRILRKTSLDELPQFWNILVGEMSLVGPRPIVDAEVPLYADHFPAYKHVRPGLTGLWQISGRNHTSYKQRVLLDRRYAETWSVWMDCKILVHTCRVVLKGDGAY